MVTRRRTPIPKKPQFKGVKLYLREWREFMGVSAPACAEALDIERTSYLRFERETWRISSWELKIVCKVIGINTDQVWFSPPKKGEKPRASLDAAIEDQPEEVQQMVIRAVLGMVGKLN